jgi:hypothetical protein
MLRMLEQIGRAVGAEIGEGPEERALTQATQPEAVSEQIDRATASGEQAAAEAP